MIGFVINVITLPTTWRMNWKGQAMLDAGTAFGRPLWQSRCEMVKHLMMEGTLQIERNVVWVVNWNWKERRRWVPRMSIGFLT